MTATATAIDQTDRRLIAACQDGLPLCPEPYKALAERLDLSQDQILERLERLLAQGVLRRIGVVPNHYALGYRSNGMSVWDVDDDLVASLGRRVGGLAFVSHCYRRPRRLPDWPFNLFAMVHGRSRDEVEGKVAEIAGLGGLKPARRHDVLFSTRILKKTGHSPEGAQQREPNAMFRLHQYMQEILQPTAVRHHSTARAGGDLEPDSALQPQLQALLFAVDRRRLPRRAQHRGGLHGSWTT